MIKEDSLLNIESIDGRFGDILLLRSVKVKRVQKIIFLP